MYQTVKKTKIITVFQTATNNPITALVSVIAPLLMAVRIYFLYHPNINKGGIFRYEYWSVFFDSIMWPLFAFAVGFLIQRLKHAFISDKKGKMYANLISIKAYCISFFYLSITAFPYRSSYAYRLGLDHWVYYIIAVVCGVMAGLLIINTPKSLLKQIQDLKQKIADLQHSLRNYFGLLKKWEYRTDNHPEFLEDLYETTKDSKLIK